MLRRLLLSFTIIAVVVGVFLSPPVSAQQTVNVFVGGFVPRSFSSRDVDDVLFRDYYLNSGGFLVFSPSDFRGATVGGEYLAGLGDRFDAGLSIGYYSRTAPAFDADFTHPDGSDVESRLALRVVPITATFRYLPLGHHDAIEPYIGAGVGILRWRYTESGDFVDTTNNNNIFTGTFSGSGTEVGPVILGGVRVPIGSARIGGEIRYQSAKGKLPSDQGFLGSTVDLGGFNYLFTFGVRF
jgi:hypothetical protein